MSTFRFSLSKGEGALYNKRNRKQRTENNGAANKELGIRIPIRNRIPMYPISDRLKSLFLIPSIMAAT